MVVIMVFLALSVERLSWRKCSVCQLASRYCLFPSPRSFIAHSMHMLTFLSLGKDMVVYGLYMRCPYISLRLCCTVNRYSVLMHDVERRGVLNLLNDEKPYPSTYASD